MDSTLNPTRATTLVIDSRDRDLSRFPLPSHYEISLDEAVHDVVSMTLLIADVPFVSYLIQPSSCTVQAVMSNGTSISAHVPVGDYTGLALAAAVQLALQEVTSSSNQPQFTASYMTLTDNISITCTSSFSLVFGLTGTMALELGFALGVSYPSVQQSPSVNIVQPPFRRNQHLNPAVILSILPSSVNTSVNQNINQSFAIITPNRNALSASGKALPQKTFSPSIARFSRAVIDFTNYDGSPVDFQNHDHRIEILLISLRAAKYIQNM